MPFASPAARVQDMGAMIEVLEVVQIKHAIVTLVTVRVVDAARIDSYRILYNRDLPAP